MKITYLLGAISLPGFVKICEMWVREKVAFFHIQLWNSQGILICVLGVNLSSG